MGGADQGGRMPEAYATGGDYFSGDTIPDSERGFLVHTEKEMLTLPIILTVYHFQMQGGHDTLSLSGR